MAPWSRGRVTRMRALHAARPLPPAHRIVTGKCKSIISFNITFGDGKNNSGIHAISSRDVIFWYATRWRVGHIIRGRTVLRLTWLQHENEPSEPVRYRALTEYIREVKTSVLHFVSSE
ncbi:hypothetical protein EVAR_16579_1 [Eumeta japonica]|uniref:Uncharacterized protein n=1 Tax=Eumeta variegata TaxID=151549 RepID=A0A4C1U2W5_EUMVA|nr:hypothetical protein EVAR_16579_1 [Eumeta japonica]